MAPLSAFLWGTVAGGVVVGTAVWASLRVDSDLHSTPSSSTVGAQPASEISRGRPRDLVCVRGRSVTEPGTSCDAQRLAIAACESRLDACTGERTAVRKSWPADGPASEQPEEFAELLANALESCGLEPLLEAIECTEYPCVAALRADGRDPEASALQLDAQVKACAPLRQAFGVGDDQLEALAVRPVQVACGDRSETALVLQAMDTTGAAWAAWQNRGEGENVVDVLRWMFRRGDDVAGVWDCADAGE